MNFMGQAFIKVVKREGVTHKKELEFATDPHRLTQTSRD